MRASEYQSDALASQPVKEAKMFPQSTIDRFWKFVEKKNDCWYWRGATHRNGYGTFYVGERHKPRMMLAHRFSFALANGYIPANNVCHRCDVRNCVAPHDLFECTQKENIADAIAKGRLDPAAAANAGKVCQVGEQNYGARISEYQARMVLALNSVGVKQADIMRMTGVNRPNVWCIVHRKSWTHLPVAGFDTAAPAIISDFIAGRM